MNYKFIIDTENEELVYNAVSSDKIQTLNVTDTYDQFGQAVTPENAGAFVTLDTQQAVEVANKAYFSEPNFYVFINDHEPAMNAIADSEEQLKEFIEAGFDCLFEDIIDIESVTCYNAGNGEIEDFEGVQYTVIAEEKFSLFDFVSANDYSHVYSAVINTCEKDEYTLEVETCRGFNYLDGNNWQSVILSYENNDYETGFEVLNDEKLERELNEAIERMKYVKEGFGTVYFETDKYDIEQAQHEGAWAAYSIQEKNN